MGISLYIVAMDGSNANFVWSWKEVSCIMDGKERREPMRIMEHVVTEGEAGRTVKSVALKEMGVSRGLFSHLKFAGGVRLDGQVVHADHRLQAGQRLTLILKDDGESPLTPYELPLKIVYEDQDYFVIDKPAPLPTLCSAYRTGPTLENALYAHLHCPKDFVFRPVNRLDKGTSGLLAVARNAHAQHLLQRQLHTDSFVREYLAVCRGHLPAKEGVIDAPIARLGPGPERAVRSDGQTCVTHYRVAGETAAYSLVRLRLETGRTHQIRVHMAYMHCPIVGDYLYGEADERLPGRFALHACGIAFVHPITGESIRRESPLPQALQELMNI